VVGYRCGRSEKGRTLGVSPERAIMGTQVRVLEHHRRERLRGLDGKVVGRYGGGGHLAVDVRLSDGRRMLFWPRDLEEISYRPQARSQAWWRSLLGGDAAV
jgi:hypothetical protein